MWSPDVHATPAGWALAQMIMAFSAVAGFGYVVYATMPERKVAKRSYPFEGLKAELGGSELTPKVSPTDWICEEKKFKRNEKSNDPLLCVWNAPGDP